MAPLTYDRLLARLDSLWDALPTKFPHPDDAARLHDVKRAIKAGQVSAERGVNGEGNKVLSPGRLKQWVNLKVAKIHEYYDNKDGPMHTSNSTIAESSYAHASTQSAQSANGIHIDQNDGADDIDDIIESIEVPSPQTDSGKENAAVKREHPAARPMAPPKISAVHKRIIRGNNTYTGVVKKTASKRTRTVAAKPSLASPAAPAAPAAVVASISDRDAAIALLELFSSSPAIGHERRAPAAPTPTQIDIPAGAYDAGAAPRDIFLAGVKYAMDNYDHVKSQMNGNVQNARRGFWDVV